MAKKEKLKTVFKNISYKSLSKEIKGYGYEYKFSTFILQAIVVLAAIVLLAYFYRLKLIYVSICAIIALGTLPIIVIAQFKHMYNNDRFEQLVNYLDQMIISFKGTPKILFAMQSTLEFIEGDLKSRVASAIEIIQNDTTSPNVYKSAFMVIEDGFPCSRLRTLHRFILNVEQGSSANYQQSLDNLYFDIRSWVTRTYQYQANLKSIKKKIVIILALSLGIAGVFSRILLTTETQLQGNYDFSLIDTPIYQVSTVIFVISFIAIFALLNSKITGYWLINDISNKKDLQISRYMDFVLTYDKKSQNKKLLISLLICTPVLILGLLLKNTLFLMAGIILVAIVLIDKGTKYKRRKKVVERELVKEFPIWMRDIAINLSNMVVVRAIEASIDNAAFIMQSFLRNFLSAIERDPNTIKPYRDFLGTFDVSELSTAFKMLYGIKNLSIEESQRQVNDLIERNQILLENSEKTRNEDALAGTTFLSLIPMLLLSFKLMFDLVIMMISFMSIAGQVFS